MIGLMNARQRTAVRVLASILALAAAGAASGQSAARESGPRIERLPNNPLIRPEMLPGDAGGNINGPTLIRVPSWVKNPLGKFYLYFAHHAGTYIRLAYADELTGPWKIHAPGTLRVEGTVCNEIHETRWADYRHVASPDVHVDERSKQIRMYFHCPMYLSGPRSSDKSYDQVTLVATSSDGLKFAARAEPLGTSYFRVFQWGGKYHAIGMPGNFYRSADGLQGFEKGPTLFTPDMRHSAVTVRDGKLLVFYTNVGDTPERILLSEIALSDDWMQWTASEPRVILEPQTQWEGAGLPLQASVRGLSEQRVRQLRDPALFEHDGASYLLYTVAGEFGIAIARIHW